jgi:hypothetical protein
MLDNFNYVATVVMVGVLTVTAAIVFGLSLHKKHKDDDRED